MRTSSNPILEIEAVELAASARWNSLLRIVDSVGIEMTEASGFWRGRIDAARLIAALRRLLCGAVGSDQSFAVARSDSNEKVDRFLDLLQSGLLKGKLSEVEVEHAIGFAEPLLRLVLGVALAKDDQKRSELERAGFGQLLGLERGRLSERERAKKKVQAAIGEAQYDPTLDGYTSAVQIVQDERLRVSHRLLSPPQHGAAVRVSALAVFILSLLERWWAELECAIAPAGQPTFEAPQLDNEFYFDELLPIDFCLSRQELISGLSRSIRDNIDRCCGATYSVLESPGWGKSHAIRHAVSSNMRACQAVDLAGVRRVSALPRLFRLEDYMRETAYGGQPQTAEALALELRMERPQVQIVVLQHIDLASAEVSHFAEHLATAYARRGGVCIVEGWPSSAVPASWNRVVLPPIAQPETTAWIERVLAPLAPSAALIAASELLEGSPIGVRALCEVWRNSGGAIREDDLIVAIEEIGRRREGWTETIRAGLGIEIGELRAEALLCLACIAPRARIDRIPWLRPEVLDLFVRHRLARKELGGCFATTELRSVAIRELTCIGRAQVLRLKPLIGASLVGHHDALCESVAAARIDVGAAVELVDAESRGSDQPPSDLVMLFISGVEGSEVEKRCAEEPPGFLADCWPLSVVLEDALAEALVEALLGRDGAVRNAALRGLGRQGTPPPASDRVKHRLMTAAMFALASIRFHRGDASEFIWIYEWTSSQTHQVPSARLELLYWRAAFNQHQADASTSARFAPLGVSLSAMAEGLGGRWARRIRREISKLRLEDWRSSEIRTLLRPLRLAAPTHELAYVLSFIVARAGTAVQSLVSGMIGDLIRRASDPSVVSHLGAIEWRFKCPTADQFDACLKLTESEPLCFLGTVLNADLRQDFGIPKFRWRVSAQCRRTLEGLSHSASEAVEVGPRCVDLLSEMLYDECGGRALRDPARIADWASVDGRQAARAIIAHDALLEPIASCDSELAAAHLLAHWTRGRIRAATLLGRVRVDAGCFLGTGSGLSGAFVGHSIEVLTGAKTDRIMVVNACRAHLQRFLWDTDSALSSLRAQCPNASQRLLPYAFAESMVQYLLPAVLVPELIQIAAPPSYNPLELGIVTRERLAGAICAAPYIDAFEGELLEYAWRCLDRAIEWDDFLERVGSQFGDPGQFWENLVCCLRDGRAPAIAASVGRRGRSAIKAPRLAALVAMYGAGSLDMERTRRIKLAELSISAATLTVQLEQSARLRSSPSPSSRWLLARAVICGLAVAENGVIHGTVNAPFNRRSGEPRSWSQLAADWSSPAGAGVTAFDQHMNLVRKHFQREGMLPC